MSRCRNCRGSATQRAPRPARSGIQRLTRSLPFDQPPGPPPVPVTESSSCTRWPSRARMPPTVQKEQRVVLEQVHGTMARMRRHGLPFFRDWLALAIAVLALGALVAVARALRIE